MAEGAIVVVASSSCCKQMDHYCIDWTKQQPTGANNYQPPCKFLLGGKNVWRGWWFGESAKISRNSLRLAESRGSL